MTLDRDDSFDELAAALASSDESVRVAALADRRCHFGHGDFWVLYQSGSDAQRLAVIANFWCPGALVSKALSDGDLEVRRVAAHHRRHSADLRPWLAVGWTDVAVRRMFAWALLRPGQAPVDPWSRAGRRLRRRTFLPTSRAVWLRPSHLVCDIRESRRWRRMGIRW